MALAAAAAVAGGTGIAGCKGSNQTQQVTRPDADAHDAKVDGCTSGDGGISMKEVGEACSCASDCRSGFCVDGFCCGSACNDKCMTCGLATSLGKCVPTPAGLPPRNASDCPAEPASSCGKDGMCNGDKGCRLHQPGVMCKAGMCNGAAVEGALVCDGKGTCKLGATKICAPFSCDPTIGSCRETCANDSQCSPGQMCKNGSCGKRPPGYACKTDNECGSGHCADGVCCNTACDGPCQACNLLTLEGTCSPTPAGHKHAKCDTQAQSSCGTTGLCDGYGTCTLYPVGTVCQGATCSGNALNTVRTCDGLGTCRSAEVQQCSPFRCTGTSCNETCNSDADCAPDRTCNTTTHSCGKGPMGHACKTSDQCESGFCVDGVCCNEQCSGTCRSCALTGSKGRCTAVPDGLVDPDPKNQTECKDTGAAACATDGRCDGAGACRKYPVGTVCAGKSCSEDVATPEWTCNASGQCVKPRSISCFPYHCNVNDCFQSCSTSAQCIAPNVCGQTGPSMCGKKGLGQPCANADECGSNFCAQGVCCNSACSGACQSCSLAATRGTCSPVQSGADSRCATQPASSCGTTGQCAGGRCAVYPSGTKCKGASCSGSNLVPESVCNGSGMCVTPNNRNCAPGRCEGDSCVNTCDPAQANQCTPPATCVGNSCGLTPLGGSCTSSTSCQDGLTCADGVCCDRACNGICETCRPQGGQAGRCTLLTAGADDPACPRSTTEAMCGFNGRCNGTGNVTTTPNTTAARCQRYGAETGCRTESCRPGSGATAAVMTFAASCDATTGMCPAVQTKSCGNYVGCSGTSCATTCTKNQDCITGVTCNTQTNRCGDKGDPGDRCTIGSDCASGNCVGGICCNVASCEGPCKSCSTGTCANTTAACTGPASCSGNEAVLTTGTCAGGKCVQNTMMCANDLRCSPTTNMCLASCSSNADCATGFSCVTSGSAKGQCLKFDCTPGAKSCAGTGNKTPRTCNEMGQWVSGTPCEFACSAGECTPGECTPGAKQCTGKIPQTCDETGHWVSGMACEFVCSAGACAGECIPGTTRCEGKKGMGQTCSPAGGWKPDGVDCVCDENDVCTHP